MILKLKNNNNNIIFSFRMSNDDIELTNASYFIRRYFLNSNFFSPTDLFIVTWDRVSSFENGAAEVSCAQHTIFLNCDFLFMSDFKREFLLSKMIHVKIISLKLIEMGIVVA